MTSVLCYSAGTAYLVLLTIKACLAIAYFCRQDLDFRNERLTSEQANHISIIQPILSGDPKLEWTLEQNLSSLHKNIMFIWMVDTDDSEGLRICDCLRKTQSNCERVAIVQCQPALFGLNPKTWKLQMGLEVCNREYLVVLDDDTTIDDSSLVAALTSLKSHSLYTGLPLYRRGDSMWSDLVAHFVANNSVLTYLPPQMLFEPITINGMFYITRSETLRSLGGFSAICHALCDDYAIKKLYSQANKTVHQGVSYQQIVTSVGSFGEYHRLMHRWFVFALQLLKDQPLIIQSVLSVFLGLSPILLIGCMVTSPFQIGTLGFGVVILLLREIVLRQTQRLVFGFNVSMNSFLSIVAECLQPLHLISAAIHPSIRWRHRTIHVGQDMR